MLRKILLAVVGILALAIGTAVLVPLLVPLETYEPALIQRVKETTGRDLRIDGDMRVSLLPRLALELSDVGISGTEDSDSDEMIRLQKLELVLSILPLLSGRLEVSSFIVTRPVFVLEIDAEGRANWDPGRTAQALADDTAPDGDPYILDFSLRDARIVDGTLTWRDRRSDIVETFTNVDLTVDLPGLDQSLEAEGELTWKTEAIHLKLDVWHPRSLSAAGESQVQANIDCSLVSIAFQGMLRQDGVGSANGALDLRVPSLRRLAAWAGSPIESPGDTLGPLRLQGKLSHKGERSALDSASIALDDLEATGAIRVDTSGTRPRVDGQLAMKRLPLDPYLRDPPKPSASRQPAGRGWSDKRIDLGLLQVVDASLDLTVGELENRGVHLTDCAMSAELKGGRLTADLSRFSVYEGKGNGKIVLDGSRSDGISAALAFDLDGFDAGALLRDASGSDRVTGTGVLDASLATRGRTERELMQSIQGKGRVDLEGGAIKGINLVAMVLHVASAFTAGDPSTKTDFSEMGGSFSINKGVLRNDDMALKSPMIQVEGRGSVDLGQRTVDYRISPKVVTPLVGNLGFGSPGIMVPVLIRGPWSKIRYEADVAGLIRQGFTAPADVVEGVVKMPGALLRGGKDMVAPKKGEDEDEKGKESAPAKAMDAIKGLFGR